MEYRSGIYENRLHVYLTEPKTYNSMERLKYADEHTEERIRDCMELIETLKKYRLELTEKAKQLQTMESHIRVSLTRKKTVGTIEFIITSQKNAFTAMGQAK